MPRFSTSAAPAPDAPYIVRRPAQVAALASPVRQEIVDAMCAIGPCSVAELAALLGRPADALYYHVRALLRVGLLIDRGTRPAGRRAEAVYDVPARRMRLRYEPANRRAIARAVASMLRVAERDFRAALRSSDARLSGDLRDVWAGRVRGWLTDEQVEEANRLLTRLLELVRGCERPQGARLHAFAFVLAPTPPARRARRARNGES